MLLKLPRPSRLFIYKRALLSFVACQGGVSKAPMSMNQFKMTQDDYEELEPHLHFNFLSESQTPLQLEPIVSKHLSVQPKHEMSFHSIEKEGISSFFGGPSAHCNIINN